MVTTATNHRPTTPTIPNNRMPKADKADKAAKKLAKKAEKGEKPSGILETSTELRNTVAAIEKQFGEGSIMPLTGDRLLPIEGISTGSLSLDIALGGRGLPRGRVVEVFGPESSGKTTLALHVAAEAQKAGGIAAMLLFRAQREMRLRGRLCRLPFTIGKW